MKYLRLYPLLSVPVLTLLTSCAMRDHQSAMPQEGRTSVAKTVAQSSEAQDFVEIEFGLGSAILSDAAKSSLTSIVSKARRAGKLDEVIVLSWSDFEYPAKDAGTLPRGQRDLAGERNRAVKAYLQASPGVDVETYNMAEKPNTLSKWINTSDNQMKRSFLAAGLPTTADSPQYEGKASHSVILVKVE